MVSEHVYTHCVMKLSNIEGNIVLYSHTFVLRTHICSHFFHAWVHTINFQHLSLYYILCIKAK